jgi:hypothetical protein
MCKEGTLVQRKGWVSRVVLVIVLVLVVSNSTAAHAQVRAGSVVLKAGAALGLASTSVGGETSTDIGPLVTGQFGMVLSSRTELTADVALQPFKAHNPVADEAFTGVYTMAGLQVGLGSSRRAYVRPELGVVFRSWSGSEVFTDSETGLAVGVAAGGEFPVAHSLGLAAEAFVRLSGADELNTLLVGLGLGVVPVGARSRSGLGT